MEPKTAHLTLFFSNASDKYCSFGTNFIFRKLESGDCLHSHIMWTGYEYIEDVFYFVVYQWLSQILCSFSANLTVTNPDGGECLYCNIIMSWWQKTKTTYLTLLFSNAWATCLAPSAPIRLSHRSSVVSV
jgi:hypothetical protein